jgi:Tol biopolymer transport system component
MCVGCGRVAFDALPDGAPGADCWAAWRSGAPTFKSVAPIAELASPEKDGNPWLTASGTTLYWDNGTGDTELYVATRSGPNAAFGARTQLAMLSSPNEDTGLVMSADDRVGVMSSSRPGSQGFDLWQVRREAGMFMAPTQDAFVALNSTMNEYDGFFTSDGKRIYYAVNTATGQLVMQSTRASILDPFPEPIPVPGMGTFGIEADPDFSPDELVIVFAARTPLTLFAATRAAANASFGAPFPLTAIVGPAHDGDPALSADGCELFFISDRGGNRDLARDRQSALTIGCVERQSCTYGVPRATYA